MSISKERIEEIKKANLEIGSDLEVGINSATHGDIKIIEIEEICTLALKEFEQSCICPACGTEWVNGDPQKCSTVIRDEINILESKLAKAREALNESNRMFYLILTPPIDEPTYSYEYKSLYERDQRDAIAGIKIIKEALKEIE